MRRVLCLGLILGIHAACASTPPAPTRSNVASSLTTASGANAGSLGVRDRWELPPAISLDDGLAIDEAVAIALWNNADFHAALGQLGFVKADLVEAGMLKNPVLSLLFPLGPKQLEAAISLAIDAFWQRPKRIELARVNADAAAHALVARGLRLIADVRRAYLDALAAERASSIAGDQADLARQIAAMAQGRLRAGEISELEARMAETEATALAAAAVTRDAVKSQTRLRLRTLLSVPFDQPQFTLVEVGTAVSPANCGVTPELIKQALAARPDVRAAELQIEAAGVRVGIEKSQIPALTAILDMNGEGKQGFEAGPGIGIEIPILSQNQGGKARAAAELEQAALRYSAVRAGVVSEVQSAVVVLDEARAAAAVFGASLDQSLSVQRHQAQSLYEAGEISLLSLLEMRRKLADVEAARLTAALGVARAQIGVEEAMGSRCMAK